MSGNRELDLGSLTLYDSTALPIVEPSEDIHEIITARFVDNFKYVFSELMSLRKQELTRIESVPEQQQIHDFTQSSEYLRLPEVSTLLPRSRKYPQEQALTKWQRFAKEKGIKKRKKSGMHYDPTLKMQVARWGKRSKQNMVDMAILQQKQLGRDPFADQKTQKKIRLGKNQLKQLKNNMKNKQ